ncbi:fungal-specific transcription factor domain-containing protein [Paramyrothecium foliicola]|nr:fungal-specific transcription factor domain-containing protein [Paramyrothecium foliicola]
MPLGPFDARLRRSRCSACSVSHLKCDGAQPCGNCQRRSRACVYTLPAQEKSVIAVGQAQHMQKHCFNKERNALMQRHHNLRRSRPNLGLLASSTAARYLFYFNLFAQNNVFITGTTGFAVEIQKLIGTGRNNFFVNAILAVGARQSCICNSSDPIQRKQDTLAALQAYSASLLDLQDVMGQKVKPPLLHVLWTTMILGLFECSKLRLCAEQALHLGTESQPLDVSTSPKGVAEEGFNLRQMLWQWRSVFPDPMQIPTLLLEKDSNTPTTLLANTFYAAASIYLSGIFDYEIPYWQSWGISVPTISEEEVQNHLNAILSLTNAALKTTTLSALLFLFPLRIAGARSQTQKEKERVLSLLEEVAQRFVVARVFISELSQLWEERKALAFIDEI